MQAQPHTADLRQAEHAAVEDGTAMRAHLRRGEAVIALCALETRIAGVLTCLHAAAAGGKRFVQAVQHLLQDLRVEVALFGPYLFDGRQLCRLHGEGHTDARRRRSAPRRLCVLQRPALYSSRQRQQRHRKVANACAWSGVGSSWYVDVLRVLCCSIGPYSAC